MTTVDSCMALNLTLTLETFVRLVPLVLSESYTDSPALHPDKVCQLDPLQRHPAATVIVDAAASRSVGKSKECKGVRANAF